MADHHERTLEVLRTRFESDVEIIALLVIGSVARGSPRPDSDIDLLFVVSPADLARRRSEGHLNIDVSQFADWPDGHAGGGVVDLPFLRAAAERGPEPARYAFTNCRVLFTRTDEVLQLLPRIAVYQEHGRLEKLRSFASQLPVHLSYLVLGELSRNPWLLSQTACELVFFAGRLILAHNRVLYGNRKQFMRQLADAPEKPEGMVAQAQALMAAPSIAGARAFYDLVVGFREWPTPPEGASARFSLDRETNWLSGPPSLADC